MMYIDAYQHGTLGYASEKVLLPELGEEVVAMFESAGDPDAVGLYVASENAGTQSSVLFWAEAQRSGVAFANPELFPWALANAPCSWLARRFRIQGPNFTYLGGIGALSAALMQAHDDLATGRIHTGFVVAIDFAQEPAARTAFGVLRVSLRRGVARVQAVVSSDPPPRQPLLATTGLLTVVDRLRQNVSCTLEVAGCSWVIQPTE